MNIVFFGGHYWDRGSWFRKQQFAKRLAQRKHNVFYVEQSISMIRKTSNDKNSYLKTKINKIYENLFVITPSTFFPFPRNRTIRNLYNKKILFDISQIMNKFHFTPDLWWWDRLDFITDLREIKGIHVVDLCDDLPYYHKLANNELEFKKSLNLLKHAIRHANINIVSATKIKDKYQKYAQNEIIVIPNGHDLDMNKLSNPKPAPPDIVKISKPRIGFIGTLFQFIDEELLYQIIKARPKYNYIFIGNIEDNFPIQRFNNFKNVFILGKKPKEQIHNYINSFDITINPFKIHEVNDSVNPVKVFEYLANKKQVVSTYMYSLMQEEISKYIHFAKNQDEFIKLLDSLVKNSHFVNDIPSQLIYNYSWDGLFAKMIKEINRVYNIKL